MEGGGGRARGFYSSVSSIDAITEDAITEDNPNCWVEFMLP